MMNYSYLVVSLPAPRAQRQCGRGKGEVRRWKNLLNVWAVGEISVLPHGHICRLRRNKKVWRGAKARILGGQWQMLKHECLVWCSWENSVHRPVLVIADKEQDFLWPFYHPGHIRSKHAERSQDTVSFSFLLFFFWCKDSSSMNIVSLLNLERFVLQPILYFCLT